MKKILVGIADAVSKALQAHTGNLAEVVGQGADGAPSLRIDRVAEDSVFRFLKSHGLAYTVVSEEAGRVEGAGEWTLVLDPIDGTHNAIRGLPAYAVSIAACPRATGGQTERLKDVEAGLVRDLVNGQTYFAQRGKGATLDGRGIQVRHPLQRSDTVFDVYLGEKAHPKSAAIAGVARRFRSLGVASLDLCMVARGAVDLYYLRTTATGHELRAVDIAAATLIVREAGGEVVDLDGRNLDMPIDPMARTNVIAYGDKQVLEMIH